MNTNTNEILIDRLDGILSAEEIQRTEQLINNDETIAKEWKTLQFIVASIREEGVHAQVSRVREEFAQTEDKRLPEAKIVSMSFTKKIMRVAAVVLLVGISATVYKFMSVTDSSVYNKYYSSYQLNTNRSKVEVDKIDNAFRQGSWMEVIDLAKNAPDKTSKHFFLMGVSHLEMRQYDQAIPAFAQVIALNKRNKDDYFQDEAEYYLAMSYLAAKDPQKAVPLLEAIQNDPQHIFNSQVKNMGFDLRVLKMKK
jgi:hypothetical protein